MQFRTEIKTTPLPHKIGYHEPLVMLGSCFSDEMRRWLSALKFPATGNFGGPLFNPESIARAIDHAQTRHTVAPSELARTADGLYFSYDTATAFDDTNAEKVAARCNEATRALGEALHNARHIFLTFGTAWVYRLRETGVVVANCHKQPQNLFQRERLSIETIVERYTPIIEDWVRHKKQIILSVSPIRHLGDGLDGNAVSKATLRLAAEMLAERFPQVYYFPAYEILLDDLRDYRFYADDLCHPSSQAVAYIRECFTEVAFAPATRERMRQVEQLLAFCAHRPHRTDSEAYRAQCRKVIEAMRSINFDFSREIAQLEARL